MRRFVLASALALALGLPFVPAPAGAQTKATAGESTKGKTAKATKKDGRTRGGDDAKKNKTDDEDAKAKADKAKADKAAKAKAKADKEKEARKPKRKGGLSVGSPNRGKLEGGVRLKSSNHLKVRENARAWGLPALTKLLRRAADKVNGKHGNSVLLVGDLSGKEGGPLTSHHSHQSGRDADIGFYVSNSKGKPVPTSRFVAFDAQGKARDGSWMRFDDARNWELVATLLADKTPVHYVFVSDALRARMLAYAAKKKVDQELYDKAAAAMMSPDGVDIHDDHFHVRIWCPESMRGDCIEESGARPRPAPDAQLPGLADKADKAEAEGRAAAEADAAPEPEPEAPAAPAKDEAPAKSAPAEAPRAAPAARHAAPAKPPPGATKE